MKIREYSGIVVTVHEGVAEVDVVAGQETGGELLCRIRTFCGTRELLSGQTVIVFTKEYSEREMALWLFVLPFIIFGGIYFLFFRMIGQEGWAAFIAILLLSPYYSYLWLLHDRLRSDPEYTLK